MKFVGSLAKEWTGQLANVLLEVGDCRIDIACSGAFSIERRLWELGARHMRGNDVSLYSCLIGWYASGQPRGVQLKTEEYQFINEHHLEPGLAAIATVGLMADYFAAGTSLHGLELRRAYAEQWAQLHARALSKLNLDLRLDGFHAGDLRDFLGGKATGDLCIANPPTYAAGYERMYRQLQEAFEWDAPLYRIFDPERDMPEVVGLMQQYKHWLLFADRKLELPLVGKMAADNTHKAVYAYGTLATKCMRYRTRKAMHAGIEFQHGPVTECPTLARMNQEAFDVARLHFLNKAISPRKAQYCFAVMGPRGLLGCLGLLVGVMSWRDIYLLSDFAVRPSPHRRLSKLILACAKSTELLRELEYLTLSRPSTIGTTAFTEKPASMKYRGVFALHSRKPGRLNYVTNLGAWTMAEGFSWWRRNHADK